MDSQEKPKMDKLSPQKNLASTDIVEENIAKLRELFPEAFTEGSDDDGSRWKVDFDALKEILGSYTEDKSERYSFTWNGKARARRIAQTPSTGTLRPCPEESINWDTTQNLFIEGDNLEVLKLLQKSYHKKIKMIYIDPPYNTGKDFIYPDDYKDNLQTYLRYTGQVDEEGFKVSTNAETSGRYHTNWLNMMYPRLKLARNLLRDDGAIFVSIDEHEIANLRKACDEIFGEENYRNTFAVRRYDKNLNRQFMESGLKTLNVGFEYVIVYAKSPDFFFEPVYREASEDRQKYGYWKGFWNAPDRPTMRYPLLGVTPEEGQWKWKESTALEAVKNYERYTQEYSTSMKLEEYWEQTGKQLKFIRRNPNGAGRNMGVEHWVPPSEGILRNTNLLDILASKTSPELKGLFDFPKSVELLKVLVACGCVEKDIVLDFFAGSCTTAHAVLDLNKEDRGNRKFIMVQLPEPCDEESDAFTAGYKTIADIGKERIRRAAAKIREEHPDYDGDLGFKVFKLDSSNIKPWEGDFDTLEEDLVDAIENIKPEREDEDILYEVLLKYGLDLAVPIEERKIAGNTVYIIGAGALVVCLDKNEITLEVVEGIAELKRELEPEIMRVVFRDSGFASDVVKTNAVQILKQAEIEDVRSI